MKEVYYLLCVKHRTSKEGKDYCIAYVGIDNEYSYDLMNVLLQPKQVEAVEELINDDNIEDITEYIQIQYNSFQKAYKPVITYGL